VTLFLRLLQETDKQEALLDVVRKGGARLYSAAPTSFRQVPGAPFAYWVSDSIRRKFVEAAPLGRSALVASGTGTLDDFRFLRTWWEVAAGPTWHSFAKGGAFSPMYYDQPLVVRWAEDGAEMKAWIVFRYGGGHWARNIRSTEHYLRPGLTWPRRSQVGLSLRAMPSGCIFADKGPAAFVLTDVPDDLLTLLSLTNSRPFRLLVSLQMAFGSYEVGVMQRTPIPNTPPDQGRRLASLARKAWLLKRTLDTVVETSHAFVLPVALRSRVGTYNPTAIEAELASIQAEIDQTAFDLYEFSAADRAAAEAPPGGGGSTDGDEHAREDEDNDDEDGAEIATPLGDALLSWAVGVAFGRFDWRLATGERQMPPEPEPFDTLPAKSPGMLPDGVEPFHANPGILVNDPGHPHDLARLVEAVLERVDTPVPADVRRWLQREFFALHLQQYSKSRRKAPIYWPLAMPPGRYTLWVYYPTLSSQTLYTAVNDFLEPKLAQLRADIGPLAGKGAGRTRPEETTLEDLQALEQEISELRRALLQIAPDFRPNRDDGVQIAAAPLWAFFRHNTWQKLLKATWGKFEKGDYDWAHLAITYRPDQVREKCKADKSLAIAHGVEDLFVERSAEATKAEKSKNVVKQ
jgi:hypothetical protein